MKIDKADI